MAGLGLRIVAVALCALLGISTTAWAGPQSTRHSGKHHAPHSHAKKHITKTLLKKKGGTKKHLHKASSTKSASAHRRAHARARHANYLKRSEQNRRAIYAQINPSDSVGSDGLPRLYSNTALVVDQRTGEIVYEKNADTQQPIASITKVMTAMVVLDANLPLDEQVTIADDDVDRLRYSSSRLRVGVTQTREELLHLALMSSENRAAAALGRTYPGGTRAFVAAMNQKARELGMQGARFMDPTGLNSGNVATARDVSKMVHAAYRYDLIRQATTTSSQVVAAGSRGRPMEFHNTNLLVRNHSSDWNIGLSKTGYINEAGHCLAMQAQIADRPLIIVLLDAQGKYTRIGDANRIRKWLERSTGA